MKFQLKASLRAGLLSLPTPRNDYEIVVPDNETDENADDMQTSNIEDQADIDMRREKQLEEESK